MYTSCERGSSLLFLRIDVCKENRSSWITANQEKAPLTHLLEIEQPIINYIFILKPFFSRSLSFTTGGRTWRFGCILHIKREKKKIENSRSISPQIPYYFRLYSIQSQVPDHDRATILVTNLETLV